MSHRCVTAWSIQTWISTYVVDACKMFYVKGQGTCRRFSSTSLIYKRVYQKPIFLKFAVFVLLVFSIHKLPRHLVSCKLSCKEHAWSSLNYSQLKTVLCRMLTFSNRMHTHTPPPPPLPNKLRYGFFHLDTFGKWRWPGSCIFVIVWLSCFKT